MSKTVNNESLEVAEHIFRNTIYDQVLLTKRIYLVGIILFQCLFITLFILLLREVKHKDKIINTLNNKIIDILKDTSFIEVGNYSSTGNDLNNNINFYKDKGGDD